MSSPLRTLGNHLVLLILSACLIQAQLQIEEERMLMCKMNCIFGLCEGGYLKRAEFSSGCKAFCHNGCSNRTCIGWNVCLCHGDFLLKGNTTATSECLLVCGNRNEGSCMDGYTKETEICKCWEGYEETPEGCHLKTTTTSAPAWAILMASCAGVIFLAVVAILILKFYFCAPRRHFLDLNENSFCLESG